MVFTEKNTVVKRPEIHIFLVIAIYMLFSQEGIGQITGSVTDIDQQALPQVNISIKGSDRVTQTDPLVF
jgi:hypothetical protein